MGIYLGPFRITKRGVRVRVGPRIARLHIGGGRPGINTGAGPFTVYKSLGRGRRSGGGSPRPGGGARAAVLAGIVVLVVIGAMIALFGGGGGTPAGKSLAAATKGAASAVITATATPSANSGAAVSPAASHSAAAAANPQPATGPGGCHPLSNEGTCYEPGEFCRSSDHGVTGLAGDARRSSART